MSITSLVPKAAQYFHAGLNVLFIGKHGTGKTVTVKDLADTLGVKIKYYSCATLDPYTDLVGIPVPRKDETGHERLVMVRPKEIDDAEFIFFDELNRADAKTLNAVFEIIQFRTINGEPLPNLKACWAAINPPDDEQNYNVDRLDPALVDRFHVYVEIKPRPSVQYMAAALGSAHVAKALMAWWADHDQAHRGPENYISPRKLVDIGRVFMVTGDYRQALPLGVTCDKSKLGQMLAKARDDENNEKAKANEPGGQQAVAVEVPAAAATTAAAQGTGWTGHNLGIVYDEAWLANNRDEAARILRDNPTDFVTHQKTLDVIKNKHGRTLGRDYAEILDALVPSVREGFINTLLPGKTEKLSETLKSLPAQRYNTLTDLRKALGLS